MNIYISLLLCFAPLVISFVVFKIFSKIKISTELFATLLGLVAVLPITFVQFLLVYYIPSLSRSDTALLPLFVKTLMYNGLLEEGVKVLFLFFIPKKKEHFASFFIASLLFGLSLGCFESAIYFLRHLESSLSNNGVLLYHLIFMRMASSVLVHVFAGGLCGLFVWSVKGKQWDFTAFVFAVLIHGFYDFFVSFGSWLRWFSAAAILFLIIECRVHYEKNKPLSDYKEYQKASEPSSQNSDVTIESALKDAPYSDSSRPSKSGSRDSGKR